MNKTTNYQLNQWERADRVLMEDFNADNAKLDAAIKAVDTKTDAKADASALAELSAALDAARGAIPKIAVGSYAGDDSSTRHISVGFVPKAVLVVTNDGTFYSGSSRYGGLAVTGAPAIAGKTRSGTGYPLISLTSSGFTVYRRIDSNSGLSAYSNLQDLTYHYFAIG